LAILLPADQKCLQPRLRESARSDYQLVISLFPFTPWAEAAKQRLAALAQ
jgi:hypothetical protein